MEKNLRELLLKDLCARLPYGVVVQEPDYYEAPLTIATMSEVFYNDLEIKPYLRPMSSMNEKERKEYLAECDKDDEDSITTPRYHSIDWLMKHHFDYRGLIPMGLALPATEGMYK